MTITAKQLINQLKDPKKEMGIVRHGLQVSTIELFLDEQDLSVKDVLKNLAIPPSTYFSKKKLAKVLDANSTEKFIRLISVIVMAAEILGKAETKNWLYKKIPSLGNEVPLSLLDTEVGHRLVTQALLQIKYGVYG